MLNTDEMSQLLGHLETIKSEAEEIPQCGGNEVTIIEQADAAIEILRHEIERPDPMLATPKELQEMKRISAMFEEAKELPNPLANMRPTHKQRPRR